MRTILLSILAVLTLSAAEEGAELPYKAEKALEAYQRDTEKALASYEEKKAKLDAELAEAQADARDDLLKVLEDEKKRATRSEDLDLALAIDAKIKEFEPEPVDLLGDKLPPAEEVEPVDPALEFWTSNTWRVFNRKVETWGSADGMCVVNGNSLAPIVSLEDKIQINFPSGTVVELPRNKAGDVWIGVIIRGGSRSPLRCERIK